MKKLSALFIRSIWMTDVIPFILVWGMDRVTKLWATNLVDPLFWGPWTIEAHYNHGVVLGSFSELPPILRLVSLTSIGALILCSYFFIRYLVPMKSSFLKLGLSLQIGGILGNVTDRMIGNGGVVDFISVNFNQTRSPVWNIADMIQFVGYGLIVVGIWKDSQNFWHKNDLRKKLWINPRFQMRFALLMVAVGTSVGVITSVMSYTFLKTTLSNLSPGHTLNEAYLKSFIVAVGVTQVCLILMIFILGTFLSTRMAGPIYAIKRFLSMTLAGKSVTLKLRKNDEFKELEGMLSDVNKKMHEDDEDDSEAA